MELMTVKQTVERYSILTEKFLRYLLLHRGTSGLTEAVVKVGRRVFIDRVEFEKWLNSQSEKENNHGN